MRNIAEMAASIPPFPRVEALKAAMLAEPRFVSIEQAKIITRVYRQTENEPVCIRRPWR